MNPVALVTGASRGIGRGVALALAQDGFDLAINYASNSLAAGQTASECVAAAQTQHRNARVECFQADIGDANGRDGLVSFVRGTFGRIDLLVNNAGVAPAQRSDILEASEASFDRLMNINVKGPYFLTQQIARSLPRASPRMEFVSTKSARASSRPT
jgi:NAD(P)-dependent dehydrogenase (short-subunit alcohol dehydrogenase family)